MSVVKSRIAVGLFVPCSNLKMASHFEITLNGDSYMGMNTAIGADTGAVVTVDFPCGKAKIDGASSILWIDDDGFNKGLPINERLSLMTGLPIFGDAVWIGYNRDDGDIESLSSALYDEFLGA